MPNKVNIKRQAKKCKIFTNGISDIESETHNSHELDWILDIFRGNSNPLRKLKQEDDKCRVKSSN